MNRVRSKVSRKRHSSHAGQGMIEYLLIVSVVALVMFVPTPVTNNMAPADYLALAIRTFFRGYSFLISVF
jgi:hypothetical protein